MIVLEVHLHVVHSNGPALAVEAKTEPIHHMQVREAVRDQLPSHIGEHGVIVLGTHPAEVAVGRQSHPDPIGGVRTALQDGIDDFLQESDPIFWTAPILIGPGVGDGLKEAVDQIPLAPCTSMPSNPALAASFAAAT
jgi:hypothetical protein